MSPRFQTATISPEVLQQDPLELFRAFEVIEDPRINRQKKYPLLNILVFAFVAILSDQESWYEIQAFARINLEWFAQYIDITSGVPSHDTFRRVFSLLDPKLLEQVIVQWTEKVRNKAQSTRRVIVLDGKSLRGVPWKVSKEQMNILNAWDATEDTFLGQMTIGCKTNEITAAPKLLEQLNLEGSVVSVDALMTQKEIAETIINRKGDYIMALKKNHEDLYEDVKLYFSEEEKEMSSAQTIEKNRGRVEVRTCTKASASWLDCKDEWKGLKTILKVVLEVYYEGKTTTEARYYITSLDVDAQDLLDIVRMHWSIENKLHRNLDVTFKEDASQIHDRNAAANLSILRKVALSLLQAIEPEKKLKLKKKEAACSANFRSRCLRGEF
jgi:predicted transposase YbfD/YdcC